MTIVCCFLLNFCITRPGLAQWLEHMPHMLEVMGSNPAQVAGVDGTLGVASAADIVLIQDWVQLQSPMSDLNDGSQV